MSNIKFGSLNCRGLFSDKIKRTDIFLNVRKIRIYFTNSKLFKCKLSETELCSFCNNTKETILHLFFECMYSKNILLSFVSLLQEKCNISYTITSKDIFLAL